MECHVRSPEINGFKISFQWIVLVCPAQWIKPFCAMRENMKLGHGGYVTIAENNRINSYMVLWTKLLYRWTTWITIIWKVFSLRFFDFSSTYQFSSKTTSFNFMYSLVVVTSTSRSPAFTFTYSQIPGFGLTANATYGGITAPSCIFSRQKIWQNLKHQMLTLTMEATIMRIHENLRLFKNCIKPCHSHRYPIMLTWNIQNSDLK